MGDALATYGSALLILVLSAGIGAGIQAACGGRRYSPISPAVGFAAALPIAWWAVRLPGEGVTALLALAVLAITGAVFASHRLQRPPDGLAPMALTLAAALVVGSIPFAAEGHFGILGTGFNVDMSQHLFAASGLMGPDAAGSGMQAQGYPLGPHALAVAAEVVNGNLALAFTGLTVAVPALAALAALTCFPRGRRRVIGAAVLVAFAYLAASWYAQGSFKELVETLMLLALIAWLRLLVSGRGSQWPREGLLLAVPATILAAGTLYAYSAPGLVWLFGALFAWAVVELLRDRARTVAVARRMLAPALLAVAMLALLAAPEVSRLLDFGTNISAVATRDAGPAPLLASAAHAAGEDPEPGFDDDLGNLFGQISPLPVFGVWPSGDFRVLPGDGSIPAPVFWLGALLGAVAFAFGASRAGRDGDSVLLGAVVAAALVWLAARLGSTPYTTAKALQILAVPVMLTALLGVLPALAGRAGGEGGRGERRPGDLPGRPAGTLVAAAFLLAAALSSGLALAKTPVGPAEYSSAIRELAPRFEGVPTQLLAPAGQLADRHGRDFYGWELRGARRACVDAIPATDHGDPPPGIRLVLVAGDSRAPYAGLVRLGERGDVVLWRVSEPGEPEQLEVDPENPTICTPR